MKTKEEINKSKGEDKQANKKRRIKGEEKKRKGDDEQIKRKLKQLTK